MIKNRLDYIKVCDRLKLSTGEHVNETLVLEQLRKDFHKLAWIAIIHNVPLFLLLQLVRQTKVKTAHVGNHRAAISGLVATVWPCTAVPESRGNQTGKTVIIST